MTHAGFHQLVADNWSSGERLEGTLNDFTAAARKWNLEVFGNILKMKRNLLSRISGIQKCLENYYSKKLVDLEKDLRAELENVLDNEELLWKQKSRKDWLTLGDRNTRYFHS